MSEPPGVPEKGKEPAVLGKARVQLGFDAVQEKFLDVILRHTRGGVLDWIKSGPSVSPSGLQLGSSYYTKMGRHFGLGSEDARILTLSATGRLRDRFMSLVIFASDMPAKFDLKPVSAEVTEKLTLVGRNCH